MLPTFDLARDSRVLIEGDSNNATTSPYQMLQPLIEAAGAFYNPKGTPAAEGRGRMPSIGFGAPTWRNLAFSGMRVDNIDAQILSDLALYNPTHVIINCGTNEVSVSRATTQAACASLAGKFAGTGIPVLWIGTYAYGEKWPSGANTGIGASNDQRLDETNVDVPTIFCGTYTNSLYVDLRTTMYVVDMPPLNAGNTYIGPFTEDGVHINPAGRAWMWQRYIQPAVRFA